MAQQRDAGQEGLVGRARHDDVAQPRIEQGDLPVVPRARDLREGGQEQSAEDLERLGNDPVDPFDAGAKVLEHPGRGLNERRDLGIDARVAEIGREGDAPAAYRYTECRMTALASELLARVDAVLRRSPERPAEVRALELPQGRVDLERQEVVFADGTRADLSVREAELLRYLAANPGRIVSREELLSRVWGLGPRSMETRTVEVHVARLRAKLRDGDARPAVLVTIRGKGYRLDARAP